MTPGAGMNRAFDSPQRTVQSAVQALRVGVDVPTPIEDSISLRVKSCSTGPRPCFSSPP